MRGAHKTKSEDGNRRNEKTLLDGNDSEPISYKWMFGMPKAKYQVEEGVPIVRIVSQLSSIDRGFTVNWNRWYEIRKVSGIGS